MPQVYTLYPPRLPQAPSVCALGLMSCLGAEAHPPPFASEYSSPSVRSGIRRDCAAGTHRSRPERPALTLTLIAFGRRYGQDKLIVKLAERKLFVTFTNVTTGSGATVFPSSPCCPAPARPCAVRHRFAYLPPSTPCTQLTAPPTLPRLILGLPPGWYALWQS